MDTENIREAIYCGLKKHGLKRTDPISDEMIARYRKKIVNMRPTCHSPVSIYDGITRKRRQILIPTADELVIQHAIMNVLKPIFMKGMYEHSYSSIPNRGVHKGRKVLERWINNDPRHWKYVVKIDIRKFFDSIPQDLLLRRLQKLIHDVRMMDLIEKVVKSCRRGLPLGFYTSPWLANWYLQDFDHYVKEELRIKYYMRYADDMIFAFSNKRKAHHALEEMKRILSWKFCLEVKNNWQLFRFDYFRVDKRCGRDIDFMGFRFFSNKVTLRRSILQRTIRKAYRMSRKEKPTLYDITQMLSYYGWLKYSNTYRIYTEQIEPYVDIRKARKRMAKHDKKVMIFEQT